MDDFFRLKRIDEHLQRIINPVSFFDVNPMNIDQEKEKVMEDPDYEPFLIYPEPRYDFDKIQEDLHSIEDHESVMGGLFDQKRNLFIDKCEMLRARGTSKFTVFAKKIYGLPSMQELEHSIGLLSLESDTKEKTVTSMNAVHKLQAELNHYGFNYAVTEKVMSAAAMVLVSKRKLYVKQGFMYSDNFIKRLVIHEIGTHVLRAENGREQPFLMFYHGFPNYLPTEEGLAVYNEERFGLLNNENLRNYAARAIAVQMAMTKSFSEIYNYLLEFFSPSTAFRITLRAKRGISDTSQPGGCPKDYVYISGYIKVKKFIEDGGDINSLYYGKIGVEHTKQVEEMSKLCAPKYLPKNQSFKSLLSF